MPAWRLGGGHGGLLWLWRRSLFSASSASSSNFTQPDCMKPHPHVYTALTDLAESKFPACQQDRPPCSLAAAFPGAGVPAWDVAPGWVKYSYGE